MEVQWGTAVARKIINDKVRQLDEDPVANLEVFHQVHSLDQNGSQTRQNRSGEMTMMAIVIDVRLVPVVTRLGRHHHPVEPETLGHCFEHSRDSIMEDNGCGFAFRSGIFVTASMVTTETISGVCCC